MIHHTNISHGGFPVDLKPNGTYVIYRDATIELTPLVKRVRASVIVFDLQ